MALNLKETDREPLTLHTNSLLSLGQTAPDAGFVSHYIGNATTEAPPASLPPPPEAFAPGTLPPPSEDFANPNSSTFPAPDASNTTIFVAPAVGLNGLLGNSSTNLNTTIVQQLTFSGAFAQSVDPALIANQFASINALSQSQVQATGVTYRASTNITMPGAAIDTMDPAVSNAMVSFLQPLVQGDLTNATAAVVILENFTVDGSALEATVQFTNVRSVTAPNATLVTFLAMVSDGSFATGLHQAATAALDPSVEGGAFSTIPAASLTAMETCQVSILAGSTTLEPTAQVQVNATVVQPNIDAGLTLSNSLRQSVASGQLGAAISSAVGYDVDVSSDTNNQLYVLAELALTQAQASAGLTTTASTDNSKASPLTMPLTSIAGALLLLSLLA
ncbi:TPA: hypothetical protein ACH3X2_009109 [Trebouxia sp. C0005]